MAASAETPHRRRSPRYQGFAVTIWEPFPSVAALQSLCDDRDIVFLVCGLELSPTTGKPHLQSAIYFENGLICDSVRGLFPRSHVTPFRSEPLVNWNYCVKGGDIYFKHGEEPEGKGARTDLQRAIQLIDDGATYIEFTRQVTSLAAQSSYFRLLSALLGDPIPRRTDKEVVYIYGVPGGGKSQYAESLCDGKSFYRYGEGKWFDGYRGEDTILIEDLGPLKLTWSLLLSLTDVIPMRCEFKNGSFFINPRRVIMTSQFPPEELYAGIVKEKMVQFVRRLTDYHYFPEVHPDVKARLTKLVLPTVHRW